MRPSTLRSFALRLVLALAATTAVFALLERPFVEALRPLYRLQVYWLAPEFRVNALTVADRKGETVVQLDVEYARDATVHGIQIPKGAGLTVSTLAGYALIHPIVLLSVLLAWPGLDTRRRAWGVVAALLLVLLLEAWDLPLMLLGAVRDAILAKVAPGQWSAAVAWMRFLDGGGRMALPLAAAAVLIAVLVTRAPSRPGLEARPRVRPARPEQ
jgi:hypothetical protein